MATRQIQLGRVKWGAVALLASWFSAAASAETATPTDPAATAPRPAMAFTIGDRTESDTRRGIRLTIHALDAPAQRKKGADRRALVGSFQPNAHLPVCFKRFSNAPKIDTHRYVEAFFPFILVKGEVLLATVPVNNACMSSGFGPRFGRVHRGIDLIAKKHDPIYSAGAGIVMEAGWARGYGKTVVIAHGKGVYTRYAHLDTIRRDIKPGKVLGFGQAIGTMGNTGNSTGVHLHYEVLTGDWGPMKAYGLDAFNPLSFPTFTPSRDHAVLTIDAQMGREITR